MNQDMENIKEQLEEMFRKHLPEKRTQDNLPSENSPEIYGNQRIEAYKNGFNQALSQINTSLIADEVLKIVVEKIKNYKPHIGEDGLLRRKGLLDYLSPNKENKK